MHLHSVQFELLEPIQILFVLFPQLGLTVLFNLGNLGPLRGCCMSWLGVETICLIDQHQTLLYAIARFFGICLHLCALDSFLFEGVLLLQHLLQ